MNLERYPYFAKSSLFDFEFYSEGAKGKIKKAARFIMIGKHLCNFAFGDVNEDNGEIIDDIISNNGDADKILATVAAIIYEFSENFPWISVLAKGASSSRTRKYQMSLNKYLAEIVLSFEIFGFKEGNWEVFKSGRNYEAFVGRRKRPFP